MMMMMMMVLMTRVQVNHMPCARPETNTGVYWKIQVGYSHLAGRAHACKEDIFLCLNIQCWPLAQSHLVSNVFKIVFASLNGVLEWSSKMKVNSDPDGHVGE